MKSTRNSSDKRAKGQRSRRRDAVPLVAADSGKRRTMSAAGAALLTPTDVGANLSLLNHPAGSTQIARTRIHKLGRFCQQDDGSFAAPEADRLSMAAEFASLKTLGIESTHAIVSATIDYVSALGSDAGADAPVSAMIKIGFFHRQGASLNERLADFFETARNIASILAGPPKQQFRTSPQVAPAAKTQIHRQDVFAAFQRLSPREKAVVALILKGLPNKLIGHEMGISITTVKAHVGAILRKLNVSSRARVISLLANVDLATIDAASPGVDDLMGQKRERQ
jgi:DNA-binding NarL/FixJ family response regulator